MDQTSGSLPGFEAASGRTIPAPILTPVGDSEHPASVAADTGVSHAGSTETGSVDPPPGGLADSMPASDVKQDTTVSDPATPSDRLPHHATGTVDDPNAAVTTGQSIVFRITRSGTPPRRLRLTGNRYTFGSAQGCSIRLSDAALRPMHAVLIRDRDRVLVRAYSVPINVDGRDVAEASLHVGSQMRLGDYTFELLDVNLADNPADPVDRRGQSVTTGDASLEEPTQLVESSTDDDAVWRRRLRREIDQWRDKQRQCDRRETQCDQREAHLRGRESELWSRAESLYRREAKLQQQESTVYQLHDQYAAKQEELLKLRDQASKKQRSFQQREAEFARQEVEYQEKLEQATRQLMLSQQQAAAATQAVGQMRQQFDSLNQQIESLSLQQKQIEEHEQTARHENQQLLDNLQSQRDAAIDAQALGESLRAQAESRVDEMTQEIQSLQDQNHEAAREIAEGKQRLDQLVQEQASASQSDRTMQAEKDETIVSLRQQIDQLQATVEDASQETTQLKHDYREALNSVRQLEGLVAKSNQRGDVDRSQWAAETDTLRSEIESLSGELEQTRDELDQLKAANQSLTDRLHQVELQRDEAIEQMNDRPTREAFDHLRGELDDASQAIARLQSDMTRSATGGDASLTPETTGDAKDRSDQAVMSGRQNKPDPVGGALPQQAEPPAKQPSESQVATEDSTPRSESSVSNAANWQTDPPPKQPTAADASDSAPVQEGQQHQLADRVDEHSVTSVDDEDVWPTYQTTEEPKVEHAAESAGRAGEQLDDPAIDDHHAGFGFAKLPADEMIDPEGNDSVDRKVAASDPVVKDDAEGGAAAVQEDAEPQAGDEGSSVWDVPEIVSEPQSQAKLLDDAVAKDAKTSESMLSVSEPVDDGNRSTDDQVGAAQNDFQLYDSHRHNSHQHDSHQHDSLASRLISDLEAESENDRARSDSVWDTDQDEQPNPFASANLELAGNSADRSDSADALSSVDLTESPQAGTDDLDPNARGQFSAEMTAMMPESFHVQPTDEDNDDNDDGGKAVSPRSENQDPGDTSDHVSGSFADYYQQIQSEQVNASDEARGDLRPDESDHDNATDEEETTSGPQFETPDSSNQLDGDVDEEDHSHGDSESTSEASSDASSDEDDEDSIEAYMNRLLGRVHGVSETNKSSTTEDASDVAQVSEASPSVSVSLSGDYKPATVDSAASVSMQTDVDPDAPLVPRSKAPERGSDLSAMRELANQTARSAISRSSKIQIRNMQISGLINFGVAGIAVLFGLGSTFLLSGGLHYLAWLMVLIIAAISIRDGLRNLAEARSRMHSGQQAYAEASREEEQVDRQQARENSAKAEARLNVERARARGHNAAAASH